MSSLCLPDAWHAQYRRAIRHPQPAEREYLAAQSTGTGVHVGKHVEGGWLVDAAMAESPAEEAGIVRGDRIIEISKPFCDFVNTHHDTIQFLVAQHCMQEAFDAAHGVTTAQAIIHPPIYANKVCTLVLQSPSTISQCGCADHVLAAQAVDMRQAS